jgi:hypothetical protein
VIVIHSGVSMTQPLSSRFFNPVLLWADVAVTVQEMWVSSNSVVQARTERMARAGMTPSPVDLAEFQLMVHEKISAVSESGTAVANQLHTTGYGLFNRAVRQWFGGAAALAGLATSLTPAEALAQGNRLLDLGARATVTASQMSSAGARVIQRGIKPIHAKAVANARRLANETA